MPHCGTCVLFSAVSDSQNDSDADENSNLKTETNKPLQLQPAVKKQTELDTPLRFSIIWMIQLHTR